MVESGWIPSVILESNDVASVRMIMMGIMLVVLMIWRPQGLVGKKRRLKSMSDNDSSVLKNIEVILWSSKPDPILKVDNVVRSFGGLRAVDIDHLEVQRESSRHS